MKKSMPKSKRKVSPQLKTKKEAEDTPTWTFLTNHAHVLITLSRDSELTLRDVADKVGITERAVQRIIYDLESAGFIERIKEGRRNTYHLSLSKPLRHPVESNCRVDELVRMIL